ncbi:hypothetical protein BJX99DRAFT_254724 [Aspergillus californicus]
MESSLWKWRDSHKPESNAGETARQQSPRSYDSNPKPASDDGSTSISEPESDIDEDDPRLRIMRWSCNQIRGKIRRLIDSKEMKVTEFQKAIGVPSKSYYEFMKQNGTMKGEYSNTYNYSHVFFAKREIKGVKPKKAAPVTKKMKLEIAEKYDVSGICLPGEEEEDVSVFDTCDEVRKKIRAHLRDSKMTQADFCRAISKTFPDKVLSGSSLAAFMRKSGPSSGNSCQTFYAAYVFFEKLRIRDGKPKTKFREEMEGIWKNGFDRKLRPNGGPIYHVSSSVYTDEYGRLRFT